jgi:hypothetical protein
MQYTTNAGTRGICPSGWHIPTYSEFQTLSTTVVGDGNALKEIGQGTGGGAGINTSGFSALLSGYGSGSNNFYLGYYAYFWSSTEYNTFNVHSMILSFDNSNILSHNDYRLYGFCIRCVKDNADGVDNKDKSELPKEFLLLQNNPNPFNPQTKISFSVLNESFITLKVYDLLGREVATLAQEKKQQGEYIITWSAEGVPGGVYFYRLIAGDYVETKKMVVLK